jgi:peptidoglycan/xylan/chitin deacetylase (PgdA/CDA1 family)
VKLEVKEIVKRGLLATGHYARRLRQDRFPGVAVLCYHGVRDEDTPSSAMSFAGLHVTTRELSAHCRFLRAHCHPISLDNWREALAGGRPLPPRPVLVTFDDGYRSLYTLARPILERWKIPAVIFVCSGPIAQQRLHWYDALAQARGEAEAERTKRLPHEEWRARTDDFRRDASHDDPQAPLTVDELRQLVASGGLELGSHTVSHPILACATLEQQRLQILEDKRHLEEWSGRPVRAFAYPNGRAGVDYTDDTVRIVEEAGFDFAFTTRQGFALPGQLRLEVPRSLVLAGTSAAEMAHRLAHGAR